MECDNTGLQLVHIASFVFIVLLVFALLAYGEYWRRRVHEQRNNAKHHVCAHCIIVAPSTTPGTL